MQTKANGIPKPIAIVIFVIVILVMMFLNWWHTTGKKGLANVLQTIVYGTYKQPTIVQVVPNLYLSSHSGIKEILGTIHTGQIRLLGASVWNHTATPYGSFVVGHEWLEYKKESATPAQFRKAVEFVEEGMKSGQKVIVYYDREDDHLAMLVVATYLCWKFGLTMDRAISDVKQQIYAYRHLTEVAKMMSNGSSASCPSPPLPSSRSSSMPPGMSVPSCS